MEKYKRRHWAAYDADGTLICVCVYRKGAEEVLRRVVPPAGPAESEEDEDHPTGHPPAQAMAAMAAVAVEEADGDILIEEMPSQRPPRHSTRPPVQVEVDASASLSAEQEHINGNGTSASLEDSSGEVAVAGNPQSRKACHHRRICEVLQDCCRHM